MSAFGEVIEGEALEVEIINWEKYNPRKDIKHPRWFAFDNRMLESAQFFHFTADELKAWIYLLSQASQKSNSKIEVFFEHAERVCGIKRKSFEVALEKLESIQVVHVSVRDPNASVQNPTATLHYKQTIHNTSALTADFEKFYLKYPRHEKKKEALRVYSKLRETTKHEKIMQGLSNYLAHLAKKKTSPEYYKLPTTWLNELPDNWIDQDSETLVPVKKASWSEMAKELWRWVSDESDALDAELYKLTEVIGRDKLLALHRDDFRPNGRVPGMLKEASEKVGAA